MHIIPIYHTYFTNLVVSFNWCAKAPELLRDRIFFCSSFKVPRVGAVVVSMRRAMRKMEGVFRDWVDLFHGFFMVGGKEVKHVFFSSKQDVR